MTAETNIALAPSEEVKAIIDTDLKIRRRGFWVMLFYPIIALCEKITNFIKKLLGVRNASQVIITNQRIVNDKRMFIFWRYIRENKFCTIMPYPLKSVESISYSYERFLKPLPLWIAGALMVVGGLLGKENPVMAVGIVLLVLVAYVIGCFLLSRYFIGSEGSIEIDGTMTFMYLNLPSKEETEKVANLLIDLVCKVA